jgi:hypothetical protein
VSSVHWAAGGCFYFVNLFEQKLKNRKKCQYLDGTDYYSDEAHVMLQSNDTNFNHNQIKGEPKHGTKKNLLYGSFYYPLELPSLANKIRSRRFQNEERLTEYTASDGL